MRTKNKITREQHRVKKAQKQESKVLYFAQDPKGKENNYHKYSCI